MSGMLDDIQSKKSTLDRGAQINIQSGVTKEQILAQRTEAPINTRSIAQNIRVDNGIRNTVNALGVLGYGDSQRETVQLLLDKFISDLTENEQEKVNDLNEIYDNKDLKSYLKKKKKK